MGFFRSFGFAFGAVGRALKLLKDYPKFIVPVVASSLLKLILFYYSYTYYLEHIEPIPDAEYTIKECVIFCMTILFTASFIEGMMASVVLELVEHLKKKEEQSIFRAMWHSLSLNLIRMLPLIFLWSVIRFIFAVLDCIFGADEDGKTNFIGRALDAILHMIKMSFMMMYPAIAWDNKGSWAAFKTGARYVKGEFGKFVSGKVTLDVFEFIVFLPLGVVVYLYTEGLVENITHTGWIAIICYTMVMQSVYELVEVLFIAELYTWARNFDDAKKDAITNKKGHPSIRGVKRPNIIGIVQKM